MKMYFSLFIFLMVIYQGFGLTSKALQDNPLIFQSEDVVPTSYLPIAIIKNHTLYLTEFASEMYNLYPHPDDKSQTKGLVPYYLKKVDNEYLSAFPLIAGILSVPIYIIPLIFLNNLGIEQVSTLANISASIWMSITSLVFYRLLEKHYFPKEKMKALSLTLIFGLCTVNFAMFSQSLWQHGFVQLFLILTLLMYFRSIKEKNQIIALAYSALAGFFIGWAVLTRPTVILVVPFIYLLLIHKTSNIREVMSRGTAYTMGFMPPLTFFYIYNSLFYKGIENQGYTSQLLVNWLGKFPEGFLGIWLSPSKGILVISPIIIFSLVGFFIVLKDGSWKRQEGFQYFIYGMTVLLHTLIMGRWKHWFGGFSFGYRLASDVLPLIVLLIVPYMKSSFWAKTKTIFYTLAVFSFMIQIYGVIFFDGIWHNAYDTGYKETSWLWNLKDSEFAFNMRRVLVKLGLMEKACPQCMPNPNFRP